MTKPHIHAEVIKAWADGKQIQYWSNMCEEWFDCPGNNPPWHEKAKYRVKPAPRPDVVYYGKFIFMSPGGWPYVSGLGIAKGDKEDNVMFVFDGETGKLKDAQVLASSGE